MNIKPDNFDDNNPFAPWNLDDYQAEYIPHPDDIKNMEFGDVQISESPKFDSAYLISAIGDEGPLTDDQLCKLQENNQEWFISRVLEYIMDKPDPNSI